MLHDGACLLGGGARDPRHCPLPEVYVGEALLVNRAFHAMRPRLRIILDAHYVARGSVGMKADWLSLSVRCYYERLNQARCFVEAYLSVEYAKAEAVL